ncbi:pilus assembly protein [Bordetella genomosp. 12]|nr:pilus assembly protein [Bordetella genomosp. 12]
MLKTPAQQLLLIDAGMSKPRPGCHLRAAVPAREPRPWQRLYRQRGQALPEMLVVAGVIAVLWFGVVQLSPSRMAVLEASQASRRWAFAVARSQMLPSVDRGVSLTALAAPQQRDNAVSAAGHALAAQWLELPPDWAAVQARPGPGMPARHTILSSGAGHASSPAETQQRVQRSALGWADSAAMSLRQARGLDEALAGLDAPWGRRRVSTDWLSPWADVAMAAANRGGGR